MSAAEKTIAVLAEVRVERARQDAKWGEQNHPDGTGAWKVIPGGEARRDEVVAEVRAGRAEEDRRACDQAARDGRLSWLHILREEVSEAFAEDGVALRRELIQVAAVAVGWIEAIDRRERASRDPVPSHAVALTLSGQEGSAPSLSKSAVSVSEVSVPGGRRTGGERAP